MRTDCKGLVVCELGMPPWINSAMHQCSTCISPSTGYLQRTPGKDKDHSMKMWKMCKKQQKQRRSGARSFHTAAPTLWNMLPDKLHWANDIASFWWQLKSHLFLTLWSPHSPPLIPFPIFFLHLSPSPHQVFHPLCLGQQACGFLHGVRLCSTSGHGHWQICPFAGFITSLLQNNCINWFWPLFSRSKKLFLGLKTKIVSNINYLYKVYPKVDKLRVTIMFLFYFLLIKRNYVIFDLHNFLVDADQNATFSLLTYLRHAITLQRDKQLSWRF